MEERLKKPKTADFVVEHGVPPFILVFTKHSTLATAVANEYPGRSDIKELTPVEFQVSIMVSVLLNYDDVFEYISKFCKQFVEKQ